VRQELVNLMGGAGQGLTSRPSRRPYPREPAGLGQDHLGDGSRAPPQHHEEEGLLVSTDVYRPAAIEQLATLAKPRSTSFLGSVAEARRHREHRARLGTKHYHDVLIVDTAERLGVDEAMMQGSGSCTRR
jgi:signal recognition particle subunit SRP54